MSFNVVWRDYVKPEDELDPETERDLQRLINLGSYLDLTDERLFALMGFLHTLYRRAITRELNRALGKQ